MIRPVSESDFEEIYEIINDAAIAYKGVIPADQWHEPYMPREELRGQIDDGVVFYGYYVNGLPVGVMGIQDKDEVNLIRHAYVRTACRKLGIGSKLLEHLHSSSNKPILIGTWADASWAIKFYHKHGFKLVSDLKHKNALLRKFWNISDRQVESSVVLASSSSMT
ncbi:MAG: GNAT family N-acetyltransferase [Lentisphaerae bacterium GWF2_44_16]|nr:MAG: GNAT family N-acetyltransferase [Lentisphaerae bacterium GWF2_44_16]